MAKKIDTGVLTEKTSNTEQQKARRFTRKHRPAFLSSLFWFLAKSKQRDENRRKFKSEIKSKFYTKFLGHEIRHSDSEKREKK